MQSLIMNNNTTDNTTLIIADLYYNLNWSNSPVSNLRLSHFNFCDNISVIGLTPLHASIFATTV